MEIKRRYKSWYSIIVIIIVITIIISEHYIYINVIFYTRHYLIFLSFKSLALIMFCRIFEKSFSLDLLVIRIMLFKFKRIISILRGYICMYLSYIALHISLFHSWVPLLDYLLMCRATSRGVVQNTISNTTNISVFITISFWLFIIYGAREGSRVVLAWCHAVCSSKN